MIHPGCYVCKILKGAVRRKWGVDEGEFSVSYDSGSFVSIKRHRRFTREKRVNETYDEYSAALDALNEGQVRGVVKLYCGASKFFHRC